MCCSCLALRKTLHNSISGMYTTQYCTVCTINVYSPHNQYTWPHPISSLISTYVMNTPTLTDVKNLWLLLPRGIGCLCAPIEKAFRVHFSPLRSKNTNHLCKEKQHLRTLHGMTLKIHFRGETRRWTRDVQH